MFNRAHRKKLSKEQREELCRLAPASDRAAESDELFFKRFPHRWHRIRRAHRAELEQHAIAQQQKPKLDPLPKGSDWFALIRKVTDDAWVRLIAANREDIDTDVSETLAMLLFEIETTPASAELERAILAATSKTAVVQERAETTAEVLKEDAPMDDFTRNPGKAGGAGSAKHDEPPVIFQRQLRPAGP